jgi:hypothetical protein
MLLVKSIFLTFMRMMKGKEEQDNENCGALHVHPNVYCKVNLANKALNFGRARMSSLPLLHNLTLTWTPRTL